MKHGLAITALGILAFILVFAGSERVRAETFEPQPCTYELKQDGSAELAIVPRLLIACLDAAAPELRDGFAFTEFAVVLRTGNVPDNELQNLKSTLLSMLAAADEDENGFRGPFAVLALSEIARTDRISPWMSEEERLELVTAGADYLETLSDYRGFIEGEGWRHGVAHTADLFMQLALSDRVSLTEAEIILNAVSNKVAPGNAPAYTFGEPERLARPVIFLARAGLLDHERAADAFQSLWPDEADTRWQAPYASEAGLVALHNTKAFANAIYLSAAVSPATEDDLLMAHAVELLAQLP